MTILLASRAEIDHAAYFADQRRRFDLGLRMDPVSDILEEAEALAGEIDEIDACREALDILGVDTTGDVKDAAEDRDKEITDRQEALYDALLAFGVEIESRDDVSDIRNKGAKEASKRKHWVECLVKGLGKLGVDVDDGSEDTDYAKHEIEDGVRRLELLYTSLTSLGVKVDADTTEETIHRRTEEALAARATPANDVRTDDPGEVACLRAYVADLERRVAEKNDPTELRDRCLFLQRKIEEYRGEIESLRSRCSGWSEVLAQKETEIASLRSDVAEQERLTAEAERRVSAARAAGWSEAFHAEKELRAYVASLETQVKRLEKGIGCLLATAKCVAEGGEVP